ncbi:4'-phosphopantetheinyl transferase family protein [Klebsiella sp. WOUb02]|uniref:4'-phosphopantetheinyl transferase family protein n=1 Tax=Klebsiella sp. WOUb02 TaxID=3161071 RepID=UPI003CE811C5
MLYGIRELPEIIREADGRPVFRDSHLPRFSIAYAGNIVGVTLTTEGDCGLDMELQHASRGVHPLHDANRYVFNSNENLWINNQHDPDEARAQLVALRRSVLKLTGEAPVRLQLLPGSGRLRTANLQPIEALCDAETVLVWSIAATPGIGQLKVWEYASSDGWHTLPNAQARAKEPSARLMRFTSLPVEKAFSLN